MGGLNRGEWVVKAIGDFDWKFVGMPVGGVVETGPSSKVCMGVSHDYWSRFHLNLARQIKSADFEENSTRRSERRG